jgi:hypothetical protein
MDGLKLVALDEQDLGIISAHVQDSVVKTGELEFLPGPKRFVLPIRRFAWEVKSGFLRQHNERRQSVLHFDRVLGVKTSGINRDKPDEVLSLLAVSFLAIAQPAGLIELVFSGGGAIMLDVECIEARLADLGGAWAATSRPFHKA